MNNVIELPKSRPPINLFDAYQQYRAQELKELRDLRRACYKLMMR